MTKEKTLRIKRYKELLASYEAKQAEQSFPILYNGICSVIMDLYDISTYNKGEMKKHFPELLAQKPRKVKIHDYWWIAGWAEPRIKALKAAIELCKKD